MNIDNMILEKYEYGRMSWTEHDMHIAFGIDVNFGRAVGVAITSILENNKDVVFHIFSDKINTLVRKIYMVKSNRFKIKLIGGIN